MDWTRCAHLIATARVWHEGEQVEYPGQPEPQDRVLVTLVPHTTSVQGTRFEVVVPKPFLQAGAFDAQGLVTVARARLLRRLGKLQPKDCLPLLVPQRKNGSSHRSSPTATGSTRGLSATATPSSTPAVTDERSLSALAGASGW